MYSLANVPWWVPVATGSAVVSAGILVLLVPQILVVLVSAAITSIGLGMISAGLSLRASQAPSLDGVPGGDRRFEHGFAGQGPRVAWYRRWEGRPPPLG